MQWLKDLEASDWIAIINAFATLALSIFVYKSTNRASEAAVQTVNLTEQTLLLNKSMNEEKEEENRKYKNSLKYQYVKILLKRSSDILKAINHQRGLEIDKNLRTLDYKHNISPENLALCFDELDVKLITDAWLVFERYLEEYYIKSYPGDTVENLVTQTESSIDYFVRIQDLMICHQLEIDH